MKCPGYGKAKWYYNGQLIRSGETTDMLGNILFISNSYPEHSGNYTCIGNDPSGNNYRKTFMVEVKGKHGHDFFGLASSYQIWKMVASYN